MSTIEEMMHRLKARLAFANFKREHGYEQYDLYTLESNLIKKRNPTSHRKPITPYPHPTWISRYPLSEKRTTSKHTYVVDDENAAAHVLVMLHQTL
ncbi:hypothetical protein EDC96DRAFT_354177 [Choanephora cucurbitarum]|nr:hypothetical protein EDC96DRAFT_354177 [Choanephora cucurbitarum]